MELEKILKKNTLYRFNIGVMSEGAIPVIYRINKKGNFRICGKYDEETATLKQLSKGEIRKLVDSAADQFRVHNMIETLRANGKTESEILESLL